MRRNLATPYGPIEGRSGADLEWPEKRDQELTTALSTGNGQIQAPRNAIVSGDLAATDALQVILKSLDDSKAEDPVSINLTGKSALGDHMVVASGRSHRHVGAIADHLREDLKAAGFRDLRVDGMPNCDWVVIDAGDAIIHIFRPEVRTFYNIEKMWLAEHPAAPAMV